MKATPPNTTNTPDASNNANLAASLPEKTAEIEKAGTSFRRALQFESSKNKRQETQTQKSNKKSNKKSNPKSKMSREMNSDQEIKKNIPQHQESLTPQSQTKNSQPLNESNPGQESKKNLLQHQTANPQPQNKPIDKNTIDKNTIDKNTKETSTKSTQEQHSQDQPTPPTITNSAATNITSQPIAADQATMVSTASSASPAELTAFIEKASQKILLARGDGAQNASLRIELHNDLLPQTQLTAQKQPDGSLNLTFTTNNPQSAHLLLQAQNGLAAHMHQTQNFNVNIALTNEQGQPLLEQNASDQNAGDQKNKKPEPNWDPVEAHLKKL